MAELKLAVGAVADVASGKEVADGVGKILDKLTQHEKRKIWPRNYLGSGLMPANGGDLSLDLGRPPSGTWWDIRRLSSFATSWSGNSTSTSCDMFVGDLSVSNDTLAFRNVIGNGGNGTATFSSGQILVRFPQHVFIHFGGGSSTQNQLFGAIMSVLEVPDELLTQYLM